jgi:hypothetical protein
MKFNSSRPTPTNGQTLPLQSDGTGNLYVNIGVCSTSLLVEPSAAFPIVDSGGNNISAFELNDSNPLAVALVDTNGDQLTSTTGALNVNIAGGITAVVGNAGGAFDAPTNASPPANAVQVGVVTATALPSAYTATDLAPIMSDKFGRVVVLPQAMRDIVGTQTTQIASSSSETTIVTAASSIFNDITGFQITNRSSTAVTVTIKDSTSGTTRKVYDLAANGGIVVHFSPPLPQIAGVNNNWTATLSSSSVTVDINVDFIKNK